MVYERRHFVRIHFDAQAQLSSGPDVFEVRVLDLSLKGVLLSLPVGLRMPQGASCRLMIPLKFSSEHIDMTADVAYVDGNHVGLLCRSIDLDSVTHLRRVIELRLGNPALLERDLAELIAVHPEDERG